MKKLLSVLLAAVMFLLPAASLAESLEFAPVGETTAAEDAEAAAQADPKAEAVQRLINSNFAAKYLAQGQEMTVEYGVKIGDLTASMLPKGLAAPVKDLLDVLTVRQTVQAAEGMVQTGSALLLNGEAATEFRAAADRSGAYFNTSLLGDKVLKVTPAQLKEVFKAALQSSVNNGRLSQETVDSILSALSLMKNDPAAFVKKAVGEPDISGLMMQVFKMLSGITRQEVTEAPEFMPDAAYVTTIPVVKEDLNALGAEISNVIWSMPAVQKLAPQIQVNGQPLTEERFARKMTTVGNHLAEDTCIRIYEDAAGTKMYVDAAAKVTARGRNAEMKMGMLVAIDPETGKVSETMEYTIESGNTKIAAHGMTTVVLQDDRQILSGSMVMDLTRGDVTFQAVTEQFTVESTATDTTRSVKANGVYRVQTEAEGTPTGLVFSLEDNSLDAGDHAEETFSGSMSLENQGERLSVRGTANTGLAEAYIISPEAVEVLNLSRTERTELMDDIQGSAIMTAVGLMGKLPASCQQLLFGLLMGGNAIGD